MKALDTKRRLYTRIFAAFTVIIFITILILTTVLYINFESIVLDQIYSYTLKGLSQVSSDVAIMTDTAKTVSSQIYKDLNISKLLYFSQDVYDMTPAIAQLDSYRLSMPFIDSIYVYSGKEKTFYISSGAYRNGVQSRENFDDREVVKVIDNFKKYKPFIPIPREFKLDPENSMSRSVKLEKSYYTFLCYDSYINDLTSAVIVNISEEWIGKVMQNSIDKDGMETFIIDNRGMLASTRQEYPIATSLSKNDYIKKIITDSNSSGYFPHVIDGVKSIVTYTEPDSYGWRYVRIIPYEVLAGKIVDLRMKTILVGVMILIAGLLITYTSTTKLYAPIKGIISKNETLENEKRNSIYSLGQDFLRNIILEREIKTLHSVQNRFFEYKINLNVDNVFVIALLKIDDYNNFKQKYSFDDRNLLKFAIMNISKETCEAYCQIEAVDMGEDRIVLILNMRKDIEEFPYEVLFRNINSFVEKYLNISISITVSMKTDTIRDINLLYNQTMEASLHRLFYGRGSIIFAENILKFKEKEYIYPIEKEQQLIDVLMLGKTDDVKKYYLEIVQNTVEFPYTVFNFTISKLMFIINNAVSTIQSNQFNSEQFFPNGLILSLDQTEYIEEINEKFLSMFDDISRRILDKRNSKHEDLILRVNEIIEQEYMNKSLSLESIAEEVSITSSYLGRLYKQHTMKTILESIIECRMNKARQLLADTEFCIAEIAEKTGFTNDTYFYRAFKKTNGVTPSEYRTSHKGT